MRERLFALLFLFTSLTLGSTLAANPPVPTPAPPSIGAPSYILLDFDSGQVLSARDPDAQREPASLAKLMTAYVLFNELREGHLDLEDKVTISERAWRMGGSRMFVEVGRTIVVEDLLRGMIIQSGNDASVALAEHVAGNEETFAQLMNSYAQDLGMEDTHFVNATGWPDSEQLTSARDIAKLARAMIRDFPEYYQYYSEREFTFNEITQRNRNSLLWQDESVDGLKTGHTSGAGYNLVSSARRDGMRLISVVMGTDGARDRMQQTQSLFSYGFRFFGTYELFSGGDALEEPKLWKGATDTIPVGLTESLYVTVPRREYENMEATMNLRSTIVAPVSQGETLGNVEVRIGDAVVADAPLVALESGDEGGLFARIIDDVMLRFQ
ncbi:D-alanyl-D-alanine carboxypeptidase family protein [Aquisalimonas sp.]|uniref:D-alanyl-D-alanine carboxypeptidase family protein n=1 Tax=Aquisalimonas sp. TaxID=1872621 RepID=UPI0025BE9F4B|nr:D-alanyl-D-alanine carboxypeptidase family protein [Aquisalimonas sp.]